MKNLTNFHKTVETDVDPRLLFTIFFPTTQKTITASAYQRIVTHFGLIKGSYSQKVLTVVKLSFDTSLLVFFFFYFCKLIHSITSDQTWTNWDSLWILTRSKSLPKYCLTSIYRTYNV